MRKLALTLALVVSLSAAVATAWPIECANGFFNRGCMQALITEWNCNGLFGGDYEHGSKALGGTTPGDEFFVVTRDTSVTWSDLKRIYSPSDGGDKPNDKR